MSKTQIYENKPPHMCQWVSAASKRQRALGKYAEDHFFYLLKSPLCTNISTITLKGGRHEKTGQRKAHTCRSNSVFHVLRSWKPYFPALSGLSCRRKDDLCICRLHDHGGHISRAWRDSRGKDRWP